MPVRFPASSFFQSSGNAAAVFGEQLRDGVATFACSLWANFPDFIAESTLPQNSFARGFMNQACSSVQPANPPPSPGYTGGQCPGVLYIIEGIYGNGNQVYGTEGETRTFRNTLRGPIEGIEETDAPYIINDGGDLDRINDEILTVGVRTTDTFITNPNITIVYALRGTTVITSVTKQDGIPDTCGDRPSRYYSPPPTSNDLNTTINITNLDGVDNVYEIQYVSLSNQYNFPMNFKVNGNNVSLDIGGINFYAPDGFFSPSGGNDVPPPGSDPSDDGARGGITKIFDDNEYVAAPESPVPRGVAKLIEYVLCTDGVIEAITTTIQIGVGSSPLLTIILQVVSQILEDICEMPEASLGLPEYYGLAPGADRPAIVYLWKILTNGKWGASTYSSTVHHPTVQAVTDIDTLTNIQKTIGTFKTLIRLSDGSTIKATGSNDTESQANFDFLLNQVDSSFVPVDVTANTIKEVDTRLQVKTLTLRQVEYYPQGKKDNVEPTIKRVINP